MSRTQFRRRTARSTESPAGLARDERGSAYAEGAIVAWFMTIVFGACLWAVQGYAAYSATGNDARIPNWREAVPGCSSGDPSTLRSKIGSGYEGVMLSRAQYTSERLNDIFEETQSNTATRSATSPVMFGGGSRQFEERSETSCNTRPSDSRATPERNPGLSKVREEALRYYCDRLHPGPEWPEGCSLSVLP